METYGRFYVIPNGGGRRLDSITQQYIVLSSLSLGVKALESQQRTNTKDILSLMGLLSCTGLGMSLLRVLKSGVAYDGTRPYAL